MTLLKKLLLSLAVMFPAFGLSGAPAQEYIPPPMFNSLDPAPVVEDDLPRRSVPRSGLVPLPSQKPQHTLPEESKTSSMSDVSPVVSALPRPGRKPPTPKASVKRPGIVKGPKTMPAVPAKAYDAEVLFKNEGGSLGGAILRRHQKEADREEDSISAALSPALQAANPDDLGRLDVFELRGGTAKKITVPYASGVAETDARMLAAVQAESLKILKENPDWRIQIQSFATPFDQGQSSDRRMALNRALTIREALLARGVEPRKIDVRALGLKSDSAPRDRVDLLFSSSGAGL